MHRIHGIIRYLAYSSTTLLVTMQYLSSSLICSKLPPFLSIILLFMIKARAVELPPNVAVPAIFAFGDSIVDTGNNNYIKTLAKCNFPPYGKDFIGGIPTGRFSNGKEFSIKDYVPAYLDPNLKPQDLLTGVCFASGSSGYDPFTCKTEFIIPISQQLEYFKEYIEKVKQLVGKGKAQFILDNSIFIVLSGNNDIGNTCGDNPFRNKLLDDDFFTDRLVNFAASFIQELYGLGARRISVFSVLPVGCLPSTRTTEGGISRKCAAADNHAAQLFNSKLSVKVDNFASELPNSKLVFIDIYKPFLEIIQNAHKYGFEQVEKGCCGTGLIEFAVLCNKFDPICSDDSKYLFWDSAHPTEKGYQTLVSLIIDEYARAVELPPKNVAVRLSSLFGDSIVDTGNNNYIRRHWQSVTSHLRQRFHRWDSNWKMQNEAKKDSHTPKTIAQETLEMGKKLRSLARAVELPPNVAVPAIFAFGDSIVDTGNNNYIKTLAKCNFPPYGKDFIGGIPTGRFSNGRVLTDFLAEELSIKQYVPAYLDPNLGSQDLLTGVCFASGSSGYDPITCKTENVIPIFQQLEYFKEYIEKVKQLVGEDRTQFILANSVFVILAGNNDILNTCVDNPFRKKLVNDDFFTDRLVCLAFRKFIYATELYGLGARRISVLSVLPAGCLPVARTIEGGILRTCAAVDDLGAQLFNSKLSAEIDYLASKLPTSRLIYIDIYRPFLDMVQNAHKYGFEQVEKGCCGTGLIEVAVLCNKFDPVCLDDSKYLFWDSIHPTEKAHQTLVSLIIDEYVNLLFGTYE
ncbi:hypothetical protein Cgig2_029067 [Carnegiea gigantea]|uniref:Uncharacterized protein n=1 Tax=Carnegiea gigantea TaxID=171969 RepID=A0A9Q1KAR5_9CARY|nr:hypothetical protein Cgig2_029067 [Carnegiea gigantea]